MRASLLLVRRAVLGAVGASSLVACNAEVIVGGGGSTGSTETAGSTASTATTGVTTSADASSSTGITLGCADPQPILVAGTATGFVQCADGSIDRPGGGTCDTTIDAPACDGTDPNAACASDADCTEAPNGRCAHFNGTCGCTYSCATDADCGPSEVCICKGLPNGGSGSFEPKRSHCHPFIDCRTDADCASGECGLGWMPEQAQCKTGNWLRCRSADDGCRSNVDCPDNSPHQEYCSEGPRVCKPLPCSTGGGRPLLVDGVSHVARARARADWSAGLTLDLAQLSVDVRARAAAHYLALAKAEHASIASFARFALALLAHGAPADLVRDANVAAMDEIAHARTAFALASAYAGEPVGPSGLPEACAPMTETVEDLVRALVHEGCVGETAAVAEILEVAATATDPVIAAHHRAIAADELRHAELAWRSLRWLLDRTPSLRSVARRAFDEAIHALEIPLGTFASAPEAGLLGSGGIARARRDVVRQVIEPGRDALLIT